MPKDKGKEDPKSEKGGPEEEDEECGFCIFMKGGGCKDQFTEWSKCVDENREGGKDFTEECRDTTIALQECMVEHRDYYKDFLGHGEGPSGESASKEKGKESSDTSAKSGQEQAATDKKEESSDEAKEAKAGGQDKEDKERKPQKENKEDETQQEQSEKDKEGKPPKESKKSEEKKGGSQESTSSGGSGAGGAIEKHEKARQDSPSKQERVVQQESHPVKAKPDAGKKEEAEKKPPKPEREETKQEDAAAQGEEEPSGNEGEAEEEEEEAKPEIKVETAPYDRRFVTTNQARHCYTRYQEFHRCAAEKGEDSPECSFFQRAYRSICPGDWVDKWNEQREEGSFAGRF